MIPDVPAAPLSATAGLGVRTPRRRGLPIAGYLLPPVLLPTLGLALLVAGYGEDLPPWVPPAVDGVVIGTLALYAAVTIGLRRRLDQLADIVRQFGDARPAIAGGPRELARIGELLNSAAADLRRLAGTARMLAGDTDPDQVAAGESAGPVELSAAMAAATRRAEESAREQQRLREELAYRAAHDPLTGLPHRAEAERLLGTALELARADGHRVGLLFIGLHGFRRCNELYGQLAGDHVLLAAAARLRAQLPDEADQVCRVGGDEFAVLLVRAGSESSIAALAAAIVESLGQPVLYEGMLLQVGARVGVALSAPGDVDSERLFGAADRAANRGRAAGGAHPGGFGRHAGPSRG